MVGGGVTKRNKNSVYRRVNAVHFVVLLYRVECVIPCVISGSLACALLRRRTDRLPRVERTDPSMAE